MERSLRLLTGGNTRYDGTTNFRGASDYRSNQSDGLSDLPTTSAVISLAVRRCSSFAGAHLLCVDSSMCVVVSANDVFSL